MILYGSTFSPFVRKVVVFAAELDVALELKGIGLKSEDPEFLAASPFGKMPALVDGDYRLADSTAICTYIEALAGGEGLIPAEARARGKTIWWDEMADTVLFDQMRHIFFNRVVSPRFMKVAGDEAAAVKAEGELPRLFDYLEKEAPADGYLVAGRLTLADIAIASPFVNFDHAGIVIDAEVYPRMTAYVAGILGRPSFAGLVAREKAFLARA